MFIEGRRAGRKRFIFMIKERDPLIITPPGRVLIEGIDYSIDGEFETLAINLNEEYQTLYLWRKQDVKGRQKKDR